MSQLSFKPAIAAALGAAAYTAMVDGTGNVGGVQLAVGAAGSVLYDLMGTQALMITKMDVKSTRAIFVFGTTLAGFTYFYPLSTMQFRAASAGIAAAAAYVMS